MFDLEKELRNYLPYDFDEAENKRKVLNFLLDNDNCFSRTNLEGHVTAGGFVCDGKGEILLNHHKASGMWFQFGGHSDGNSNSLEVAIREIGEESGITNLTQVGGIFDVDVQLIPDRPKKNEPEHYHYDINFLFVVNDKKFNISNESTEIKWVTIDEAKHLVDKKDAAMHRMINKYEELISNNIIGNKT